MSCRVRRINLCGATVLLHRGRIVLCRFGYSRQIRQRMSPTEEHAVVVGIALRCDVEMSQRLLIKPLVFRNSGEIMKGLRVVVMNDMGRFCFLDRLLIVTKRLP